MHVAMQAKSKDDKERVTALGAEGGDAEQGGSGAGKEKKAKKERKPTVKSAYMVRVQCSVNTCNVYLANLSTSEC